MSIVFSPFSFQYLIKVEFFTFSPTTSCLFPSRARGFPFLPFPTCQRTHLPLGHQGIPGAFQTTFHIRLKLFHYILYNSWLDTWMNALPLPCSVSFPPSVTFLFILPPLPVPVGDTISLSFFDTLQTEAIFLPQYSKSTLFGLFYGPQFSTRKNGLSNLYSLGFAVGFNIN